MNIIHPQQPIGGLNTEDTFLAMDDLGVRTGIGYIMYQLQPGVYPDCPVNMYFSLEADSSSRYMLLGALIARARVLQEVNPQFKARLYTGLSPDDIPLKEFYLANGFNCDGSDDLVQLTMPYGDGRIPMSCTVAPTPLHTPEEQAALLYRLQTNEVTFIDQNYLNSLMRTPHFMTLGLYRNSILIGEVIMAGQGSDCELSAIYIEPGSRQQGMAKALLHRMMAIMGAEGVTRVITRVMSRSIPQQRLMANFGATLLGVNMIFPQLEL